MESEIRSGEIQDVTMTDILGLQVATWDRPRTTEYLRGYVKSRLAELAKVEDDDGVDQEV